MDFLTPIVPQLPLTAQKRREAEQLQSDAERLEYLLQQTSFSQLAAAFEHYYGVALIDLSDRAVLEETMAIFDAKVLQHHNVLPYAYDDKSKTYYFAISDILNDELRHTVTRSCKNANAKAKFAYAPKAHIQAKYDDIGKAETHQTDTPQTQVQTPQPRQSVGDEEVNAQDWVNNILNEAIRINASDIHIEPLEHALQVRYRVDGVMTNKSVYQYSESIVSTLFVRLKVISGLDISEKRKPQDGRIDNYQFAQQSFDLRVSTVTTVYGEKAVLRLLNKSQNILTFDELGFSQSDTDKMTRMLANKNGIIYIGGATGSGKTTSLYTMIDTLNDESVNMYTIENPVEKTVENVNQIQINPLAGITYPSTLKALLRQDPDIIVVGEIRDTETAELSVRASLTGHLVLSTIHANSALDSINRLLNMGVEPYLIVGSSLGFLSQRLVRKLCNECKVPQRTLSTTEESWLVQKEAEYGETFDRSTLYEAKGCDHCHNGYKGRIAAVEIVEITDEMKQLILEKANTQQLKQQALSDGFAPMAINGIQKAVSGQTTIAELIRELT